MTVIHRSVVIIGAGLSGLTTAYRLKEQGIKADIFEARQRVGGRILTVAINNQIGELGAENILDGGKCENILKLLTDLNLKTQSGKQIMMTQYDKGTEFIDRTQTLRQYKSLPDEHALPHHLQEIAKHSRNMEDVLQLLFPDQPMLRHIFSLFLMGYEGAPAKQLSTFYAQALPRWIENAYHSDEDPVDFEYMLIQEGSAQLVEKLHATLGDQIHLGRCLQTLTQSPNGQYQLQFANGQKISADRVVLSMPCGVYADIVFDVRVLSSEKLNHICNVTYGKHSKILVPLKGDTLPPGVFLNDRLGTFSFNTHLLTMYYITQPQDFAPEHIAQLFEHDSHFVEKAYHIKTSSHQPAVYAKDEHYAHYDSPVGYNWAADPYARGSYSCIGAGQDEIFTSTTYYRGEIVKQLFMPIADRLFFAGEHTSILMDGIGTMEAAVEAGERTARMLYQNIITP